MARSSAPPTDATAPLWRAAAAFRLVTVLYLIGFQTVVQDNYSARALSWVVVALAVTWSGVVAVSVLAGARRFVVMADQVITLLFVASTVLVADETWRAGHQVLPTTLWVSNAVIAAAIVGGPRAGLASAVVMTAVIAVVRGTVDGDLWRDSTGPILMSVGLALGLAARTARDSRTRLDAAVAVAAAAAERERLSREVHDGVLQVLAMVSRRGHEIGGESAELADLAGEQEAALRSLLSGTTGDRADGTADITGLVRSAVGTRAVVSAPSGAVVLQASAARDMTAATLAAVDNARRHGGPDVHVFVLVEDLDDEVVITVRDDGPGIADGRLDEARAEGRLGVSGSIIGRMEALGGTASVDATIGEGTEWELVLHREQ